MNLLTKQDLTTMRDKAVLLGAPPANIAFLNSRIAKTDAEETANLKALGELYDGARSGDRQAKSQLCGLIIETTQNFIVPNTNWMEFYQVINLGESDNALIHNETKIEVGFYGTGQDSRRARQMQVTYPSQQYAPTWKNLTSERVSWKIRDIATGNVEDPAKRVLSVADDLAQKMEGIVGPYTATASAPGYLRNAFGNFALSGSNKASRVYVPHSRIQSGILPTTNQLSTASISTTSKFSLEVITAIISYCAKFAGTQDIDGKGELAPTGVIRVRSDEIQEIADSVNLLGATQTGLSETIARQGWYRIPNVWGINWTLVPDSTIPSKTCYAQLNRPVGRIYFKPSFDMKNSTFDLWNNEASLEQSLNYALAIPTPNVRNVCSVKYRD